MRHELRYPRWALLLAVAAGWPLSALAAAGLVQFSAGDVQLRRAEVLSALVRGASVEGGDVVLTGASGRAQIRFTDGGVVSLSPGSQFAVERYVDSGDAAQDRFAVNLARGGLRAVTGLIGKRNPANYKVITPTAVVGIRGSAFRVFFNAEGLVEVAGEQDEIEVCTQAGCVGVKSGESVLVRSGQELPVYTNTRALLPLPPPQLPYAAGEQLRTDGSSAAVIVTPPPPPPPPPLPPPPEPPPPPPPQNPVVPPPSIPVPTTPTPPPGRPGPSTPTSPTAPTAPTSPTLPPIGPVIPIVPIFPISPPVTGGPPII